MAESTCPSCGARFAHPEGMTRGSCPSCRALIAREGDQWSVAANGERDAAGATIVCPACCSENDANNYRCTACGELLRPEQAPPAADSPLSSLIPYRNAAALAAYYCGVFSLIPCVGVVLAFVALALGVQGLRLARAHPEAKGKGHALAGIILGTIVLVGHIIAIIAMAFAAHS